MASTTFVNFQPPAVDAEWLNDLNAVGYDKSFPDGKVALTKPSSDSTVALLELGSYAELRLYTGLTLSLYVRGAENVFDGGFGVFSVDASDITSSDNGGTVIVDALGRRWKRSYVGRVKCEWFRAKGDAVTDCYDAIQAVLNLGVAAEIGNGIYRVTQGLVWKNGSKLFCSGNWSGVDIMKDGAIVPKPAYSEGTTVIKYDGTADANAAVARISDTVVGVEPTDIWTRNMMNVGLCDVVLDGNGKAGFGLYIVRGLTNNSFNNITVTGTTQHGFAVMISFAGQVNNWMAVLNRGCGITIGKNLFGWASNNVTVDECQFNSLFAYYNGCDANRNTLNVFDETTNKDKGYGLGFYQGRATVFINAQSAQNDGVGVFISSDRWPVKFFDSYIEHNCHSSLTTDKWGIWVEGIIGGVTRHVEFNGVYLNGPIGAQDAVRLSGTAPSRNGEDAVILRDVPFLRKVKADWANYRLVDCDSTVTIEGTKPLMIRENLNGFINCNITGLAVFDVSGAAISTVREKSGVVSDITYQGTGIYRIAFTSSFPSSKYGVLAMGSENRQLTVYGTPNVAYVDVISKNGATPTDSGRVSVLIIGGYDK